MFAYSPTVNDTSGQIQGAYNYEGAKGIASGISTAGSAIGSGMMKAGEQANVDRKTLDMVMGKADQYRAAGLMDDKTYGDITRSSLSKATGILAGFEATTVNPFLEKQKYQSYADAQMQIKGAGSGASGGMDGFTY